MRKRIRGMGIQNLRNKYKNHPVIKPLINYCEENEISFELIKETREVGFGFKSFRYINSYYMKIGDNLVEAESSILSWDSLFDLLIKAYKYLNLDYPDNLIRAAKTFRKTDLII